MIKWTKTWTDAVHDLLRHLSISNKTTEMNAVLKEIDTFENQYDEVVELFHEQIAKHVGSTDDDKLTEDKESFDKSQLGKDLWK